MGRATGQQSRHFLSNPCPLRRARVGGFEVKMYGPEGVLFDIAEHPWTGSEALPAKAREKVKEPAE